MHRAWTKSHCLGVLLPMVLSVSGTACGTDAGRGPADEAGIPRTADCLDDGRLTVRLHGAIDADVDWRGPGLACEGMPRPGDRGARLRFSGALEDDGETRPLALIIALPGLVRGETMSETPARLTLIEEDGGRFFTTGELDACWSDVTRQERLSNSRYAIGGIVYCLAPLAEVQGSAGVSFTELAFAGHIDWSGPQ